MNTEPTFIAERVNGIWFMHGEMWLWMICPIGSHEEQPRNWYEPIEDEL